MRRPSPLRAEQLEPRETPATFGTPWPDGRHLTLSLAPDGTAVGGTPGDFATFLQQLGPSARLDALRAFQTWAVQADVNVGLVADTGAAFGTGGPVQGDPRFGDIRVGGRSLAHDVLAVTAPYAPADNYSGNVVVNTAARFGPTGYDLFTALLQESGHALGIGNSPDVDSVMYEYYQGTRTGLSAGDVASIRSLYGARPADAFEGAAGNGTPGTAAWYTQPLEADLSSVQDVDVYKVTTGLLTTGLTVSLRAAGLSLVTAKVELLNAAGAVISSALVTDPTQNDVTLSTGAGGLSTYYVRVSASRTDVFGAGAYKLEVTQQTLLTPVLGLVGGLLDETGLNDTLLTATGLLASSPQVVPATEFNADGNFGSASDVDFYRITVPPSTSGTPVNLVATVWGKNGTALNPWVEVEDVFGHQLAADLFTADGNTTTVQARGLQPGGVYFIKLNSDTGGVGAYSLSGDLRAGLLTMPRGATGTLDAAHPSTSATLKLAQTGQVHFVLSADGSAGQAVLTVTKTNGTEVARVTAPVGRGRSVDVFLPDGQYQVKVTYSGGSPVVFALGVKLVTDPVGAKESDPTGTPDSGCGDGSGSPSSGTGSDSDVVWIAPSNDPDAAQWY
jgi:hypothetical protein